VKHLNGGAGGSRTRLTQTKQNQRLNLNFK